MGYSIAESIASFAAFLTTRFASLSRSAFLTALMASLTSEKSGFSFDSTGSLLPSSPPLFGPLSAASPSASEEASVEAASLSLAELCASASSAVVSSVAVSSDAGLEQAPTTKRPATIGRIRSFLSVASSLQFPDNQIRASSRIS